MDRRSFLHSVTAASVGLAATPVRGAELPVSDPPPTHYSWWQREPVNVQDWPVLLGTDRQLFVDDHLIADTQGNIEKQFHQPRKHTEGYVVAPEHPWEGTACLAHGTVVQEPSGRLRMYYVGSTWHVPFEHASENPHNNVCVAYSDDGLHWEKPKLGLYPWQGRNDTNLVLPVEPKEGTYEQFSVLHDPEDPDPKRRWKMGCYRPGKGKFLDDPKDPSKLKIGEPPYQGNGYYPFFSEDGLRWRIGPEPIFTSGWTLKRASWPMPGVAENSSIMYDHVRRKYIAFVRIWDVRPDKPAAWRARGICESDDFLHWTTPRVLFLPLEDDEPGLQFYSSTGFNYESMYLGLLRCYRSRTTGQVYFQLVSSRDGVHWDRAAYRQPFIDNGPVGSLDGGYHSDFSNPPIRKGDELWFYYGSSTTGKSMSPRIGGICLAKLRVDGFASVEGGEGGGRLLTRPMDFKGAKVSVNASPRSGGRIQVEVLDRHLKPVEGFGLADSVPVTSDSTSAAVRWRKYDDLSALQGRTIRLKFHLTDAGLYSFWIS